MVGIEEEIEAKKEVGIEVGIGAAVEEEVGIEVQK